MSIPRIIASAALAGALASPLTVIGNPGDLALGSFHRNLYGISVFTESGSNVQVYGAYSGLQPGSSYFTVIYSNGNCDPAQAFPVGPFQTDAKGRGTLKAVVPGKGVDVGGTRSVSVRRGDDATDQDGDKITGPGDVVAVPGNPGVGLVECDRSPQVF